MRGEDAAAASPLNSIVATDRLSLRPPLRYQRGTTFADRAVRGLVPSALMASTWNRTFTVEAKVNEAERADAGRIADTCSGPTGVALFAALLMTWAYTR